jgi:hypothetical protein
VPYTLPIGISDVESNISYNLLNASVLSDKQMRISNCDLLVVTSCTTVRDHQRLGGLSASTFRAEDRDSKFLRNGGDHVG